jgi:hypothetical protein
MTDFFREVDEEVRRDRVILFWQKYQTWLIGGVLLIILGTAAWRVYENARIDAAEAAGIRYEAALRLLQDGKTDEALAAFGALSHDGPNGYAALARFAGADLTAAKDPEAGIKAYETLAFEGNIPPAIQAVAQLRAAMLRVDRDDPKEFEQRFAPLAAASRAYRNSYRELLALAAFKRDDFEAAGRWLNEIVVDFEAPQAVRSRAQALLGLVRAGKLPSK